MLTKLLACDDLLTFLFDFPIILYTLLIPCTKSDTTEWPKV